MHLHRFKPEMITNALLALREDLIRDGGPGLEHVEALLVLRGSNLPPVPRKLTVRFRRNRLRAAIREALRGGPVRAQDVARRVSEATGEPYEAISGSVRAQLCAMKAKGRAGNGSRLWWLPEHGPDQGGDEGPR